MNPARWIREWWITAKTLSDKERRSILLAPAAASDYVEAKVPHRHCWHGDIEDPWRCCKCGKVMG